MMPIESSIEINATPEQIFRRYNHVAEWPAWDSEVTSVHLPDGLREGLRGWLKPRKGPKASIAIVHIAPGKAFTVESKLPFCRMTLGHELAATGQLTIATHWASFTGPLEPLFRRLIGNKLKATLPKTYKD